MVVAIRDLLIRYPGYRHRPAIGYPLALVFVALALLIRMAASSVIADSPYITFIPAVLLATFLGGRGPGLTAAVLSAISAHFMITPGDAHPAGELAQYITMILYLIVASVIALLMDWLIKIAEQNAILARRTDALLTELQHRVKNHIQIVASLLNLQARRADSKTSTALADVARRINMISSAYSHLYRADLQIDFAHHLHDIADSAVASTRAQRSIDVVSEPVMWGMDHVMPLSMIASELIDNALRHGLVNEQGRVEVHLAREGAIYVLRVSDSGNRLPPDFDVLKNAGLGLQLSSAMARRLNATIRAEHHPRTSFIVEFSA